jgi:hypothetical protein
MFERYYSIAQSFSTQYLHAQINRLGNRGIKYRAYRKVLETRLFIEKKIPVVSFLNSNPRILH